METPEERVQQILNQDKAISLALGGASSSKDTEEARKLKAHANVVGDLSQVLAQRRANKAGGGEALNGGSAEPKNINNTLQERAKLMKAKKLQRFD